MSILLQSVLPGRFNHSSSFFIVSVYIRKLSDEEQPLRLRLLAGPNEKALSFVLKENETGEVNVSIDIDISKAYC